MAEQHLRVRVFAVVVVLITVLFLARAAELQLIDTDVYSGTSRKNSIHTRLIEPARGVIYDRDGQLLVDNEPTYTIRLTPVFFDSTKTDLLADLLRISPQTVRERLQEAREWSPYKPSRAFREVPDTVFARVQENLYRLPGVDYIVDEKRRYHAVRASHLLGYVKEVSRQQLDLLEVKGYRQGDRVGQAGVESAYDSTLRGRRGREFKQAILGRSAHESDPYNATARLWDGGILDPAQTRTALGLAFSVTLNAPFPDGRYGTFRM
jgi:penicillin-binding protein 2